MLVEYVATVFWCVILACVCCRFLLFFSPTCAPPPQLHCSCEIHPSLIRLINSHNITPFSNSDCSPLHRRPRPCSFLVTYLDLPCFWSPVCFLGGLGEHCLCLPHVQIPSSVSPSSSPAPSASCLLRPCSPVRPLSTAAHLLLLQCPRLQSFPFIVKTKPYFFYFLQTLVPLHLGPPEPKHMWDTHLLLFTIGAWQEEWSILKE